jgi:hypothetical protein
VRTRRIFCATVLVSESLVVFFALLVAKDLSDVATSTLVWVGGGTSLACLLLTGLLRYRWSYALGSVLQVVLVLAGFIVPAMFFLGTIFAVLWFVSLSLSARIDGARAEPDLR